MLTGLLAPPLEHGAEVEVALVDRSVRAADDVVELVEGVLVGDLVSGQQPGRGTQRGLHLLEIPQRNSARLRGGQVQVAEVVGEDLRHLGVATEMFPEVTHVVGGEAADLDVQRVRELLSGADDDLEVLVALRESGDGRDEPVPQRDRSWR